MRAVAKILRARASEHTSNFCEQFEQRPNFASTFKLNGTIRYPYYNTEDLDNVTCKRKCPVETEKFQKICVDVAGFETRTELKVL